MVKVRQGWLMKVSRAVVGQLRDASSSRRKWCVLIPPTIPVGAYAPPYPNVRRVSGACSALVARATALGAYTPTRQSPWVLMPLPWPNVQWQVRALVARALPVQGRARPRPRRVHPAGQKGPPWRRRSRPPPAPRAASEGSGLHYSLHGTPFSPRVAISRYIRLEGLSCGPSRKDGHSFELRPSSAVLAAAAGRDKDGKERKVTTQMVKLKDDGEAATQARQKDREVFVFTAESEADSRKWVAAFREYTKDDDSAAPGLRSAACALSAAGTFGGGAAAAASASSPAGVAGVAAAAAAAGGSAAAGEGSGGGGGGGAPRPPRPLRRAAVGTRCSAACRFWS